MAFRFPTKFAKFESVCTHCHDMIHAGDPISWARRGEKGRYIHFWCVLGLTKAGFEDARRRAIDSGDVEPTSGAASAEPIDLTDDMAEPTDQPIKPAQHAPAQPGKAPNGVANAALHSLAEALLPLLEGRLTAAKTDIESVRDELGAFIEAKLGELTAPTVVQVHHVATGKTVDVGTAHKLFQRLLYEVQKRRHSYLYGAPGSGKSFAAKQCADALGLPYAYIAVNPQTPASHFLGFIRPDGSYQTTEFFRMYTQGGIMCIDEMDNSAPALMTTLNGMLENGGGFFPHGNVPRHADFVCICTGNTPGRGATPQFPDRRPFDTAFAERFTFIAWDYDEALENAITFGIYPDAHAWLRWVRAVRSYVVEHRLRVLASPRASFKGASDLLDGTLSIAEIAHAHVFKGVDTDTVNRILAGCPLPASLTK